MGAQDLMARYEAALNTHAFQAVEPLISSDAVFWFNDGSHRGLKEVRAAFEKTFRGFPLERYWLENLTWLASGDTTAACVYRFRWTATIGGKAMVGGGRGTNVLRKDEGGWKIVHEHLSQAPRAASP